jgi:hypothetical protein
MRTSRSLGLTLAACVTLAIGGFFGARLATSRADAKSPSPSLAQTASVLRVPHLTAGIVLDGDQDDPGWRGAVAHTGPFLFPNGSEARPQSQARAAWGDGHLYLSLYAADEDLRATTRAPDSPPGDDDSFHVTFTRGATEWDFDVSAAGVITDGVRTGGGPVDTSWDSGAHVSVERDGTMNDPRDNDEEWLLELAIPLDAIGLGAEEGARVGLAIRRCDTLKSGEHVCAGWGEAGTGAVELL